MILIVRSFDVETTGFPPRAAVCELGWTDVSILDGQIQVGKPTGMLLNPGRPIPAEASAIHGIYDTDVANSPNVSIGFRELTNGADVFCAHNAEFERNFFGTPETQIICTYKVALVLFPDAPNHRNGGLAEHFASELSIDPALAVPLHRAGPDSYVTAHLLAFFLRHMSVEEMLKVSRAPRQITRMPFGKHKGVQIEELPTDYMQRAVSGLSNAPDIVAAMKRALKTRE